MSVLRSARLSLALLALSAAAQTHLERRIGAILDAPAARQSHWGVLITDLQNGAVLYEHNGGKLFQPASNMKLFTTALALVRLGPDYRFHTRIAAAVPIRADGTLPGDLYLIGGGDPSLSGRTYPYAHKADWADPIGIMDSFAARLAALNLKRIAGAVVGDDTRYPHTMSPTGWTQDDAQWEYGAPVSALSFNDNAFRLTLRPAERPGGPARLSWSPFPANFAVDNRVVTAAKDDERKIVVERRPGSTQLLLEGSIPAGARPASYLIAAEDPALYAAQALKEALERRGITVDGPSAVRHRPPRQPAPPVPPVELVRHASPPLSAIVQVVNKVSQNLHAEILLLETAAARGQEASREEGLAGLQDFLAEAGAPKDLFHFEDGSGLSRRALVSPRAVMALLRHMHASEHRRHWLASLPVAGEDGTLSYRFQKRPEARAILAKTGTLGNVSALSGYAGPRLAFSIIVNHHTVPSSAIRALVDEIVLCLLD